MAEMAGACLVGSVPLDAAQAVFSICSATLGAHLRRIPDGETGERSNWIQWQTAVFDATEGLERVSAEVDYGAATQFKLSGSSVKLPPLGYAQAALTSYEVFKAAKARGEIAGHLRFLVSLPTPLAPVHLYIHPDSAQTLDALYSEAMASEVTAIINGIAHEDLAIQWDTAVEFGILEGVFPTYLADPMPEIVRRLVVLGEQVPSSVELGNQLCNGDAGHKHFCEPQDTGLLADVAGKLLASSQHPVDWLHMPVPRSRDDAAYFQPLAALELPEQTDLYLGLIHASDGEAGARRRMATASRMIKRYGVATECGLGRRSAETIAPLLELHATLLQ